MSFVIIKNVKIIYSEINCHNTFTEYNMNIFDLIHNTYTTNKHRLNIIYILNFCVKMYKTEKLMKERLQCLQTMRNAILYESFYKLKYFSLYLIFEAGKVNTLVVKE